MNIFERIIHEDDKGRQVRLTINEFRNQQYLGIRYYYQDFEGDWKPSNEGVSMPLGLSNTLRLFLGLSEIVSEAEIESLNEALKDIVRTYKEPMDDDIPFWIFSRVSR